MDKVKKKYNQLTHQFPNGIYCHELYGSFVLNILLDIELGSKLLSQKENFVAINKQKNKDKFLVFSESNGFLLVSADLEDFGMITYANEIAGQILNQAVGTIVGNKINSYIPEPYDKDHDLYMKNFIINCHTLEPDVSMGPFLKTERGYLVECTFRVRVVSMIDKLYFLISIKPHYNNREIAFISSDGIINSHSEQFPMYMDRPEVSLKHRSILEFIPCLDMNDFMSHYMADLKEPAMLVHKIEVFKTYEFHILLLIHDSTQILELKNYTRRPEISFNLVNTYDLDMSKLSHYAYDRSPADFDEELVLRPQNQSTQFSGSIKKKENEKVSVSSMNNSTSLLSNLYTEISQRMGLQSDRALKIFK